MINGEKNRACVPETPSHSNNQPNRSKFGVLCKSFRLYHSKSIADQSKALKVSMSFISQVETGRKPIPHDYMEKFASWLGLSEYECSQMRLAAAYAVRPVKVVPLTIEQAVVASEFSRVIANMTTTSCNEVLAFLQAVGNQCQERSKE